jgi:hypothetical protein
MMKMPRSEVRLKCLKPETIDRNIRFLLIEPGLGLSDNIIVVVVVTISMIKLTEK